MNPSLFVVWIDQKHANVFQLKDDNRADKAQFEMKMVHHHTHPIDQLDVQRAEKHLFETVAGSIKDAERFVILGPGVAKHHFQNHIFEQHPSLGKRIVACETSDHPTDPQLAAWGRRLMQVA